MPGKNVSCDTTLNNKWYLIASSSECNTNYQSLCTYVIQCVWQSIPFRRRWIWIWIHKKTFKSWFFFKNFWSSRYNFLNISFTKRMEYNPRSITGNFLKKSSVRKSMCIDLQTFYDQCFQNTTMSIGSIGFIVNNPSNNKILITLCVPIYYC